MKHVTCNPNHEMWHECTLCGAVFDRHLHGNSCPECGYTFGRVVSKLIYPVAILLMMVLISLCSCTTTCHSIRKQQTVKAQRHIQLEHSTAACKDGIRPFRNWNSRPHGHWPFQFLQ